MSTATLDFFRIRSVPHLSTTAKLAASFIAAHTTALSIVGLLYVLGLYDVGFLSPDSLIFTISKHMQSLTA